MPTLPRFGCGHPDRSLPTADRTDGQRRVRMPSFFDARRSPDRSPGHCEAACRAEPAGPPNGGPRRQSGNDPPPLPPVSVAVTGRGMASGHPPRPGSSGRGWRGACVPPLQPPVPAQAAADPVALPQWMGEVLQPIASRESRIRGRSVPLSADRVLPDALPMPPAAARKCPRKGPSAAHLAREARAGRPRSSRAGNVPAARP